MRARSVQAIDELIGRSAPRCDGARRPQHVRRVRLRQRLPPRPAPPDRPASGRRSTTTSACRWSSSAPACARRRRDLGADRDGRPGADVRGVGAAPADPRRDGRSLTPLLDGAAAEALATGTSDRAHRSPASVAGDPDIQGWAQGMPSSYTALRTRHTTYVEYANGDREFYDRRRDPGESQPRRPAHPSRARAAAPRWRATGAAAARPTAGSGSAGLVDDRPRLRLRRGRADGRRRRRRRRVGGIHDGSGSSRRRQTSGPAGGRAAGRPFLATRGCRSTR